jgi:hypothetical protein
MSNQFYTNLAASVAKYTPPFLHVANEQTSSIPKLRKFGKDMSTVSGEQEYTSIPFVTTHSPTHRDLDFGGSQRMPYACCGPSTCP